MKEYQQDDERKFFERWETRVLPSTSKKLGNKISRQTVGIEALNFDERYIKLRTKLESELDSRITYLKYDRLPEIIPEETIIDMTGSTIGEDIMFTSEEIFILRQYNNPQKLTKGG